MRAQVLDSAHSAVGRACPYCRFAIKPGTPVCACQHCNALHHGDCWSDNGGCAIVACAGGPAPGSRADTVALPVTPHAPYEPPAPAPYAPPPPAAPPPGSAAPSVGSAAPSAAQPAPVGRRAFIAMLVAVVLASAAVGGAAVLVLGDDGEETSGATADPGPAPRPDPGPDAGDGGTDPGPVDVAAEERTIVRRVASILELSKEGRALVLDAEFARAARNRRRVLARIEALPPATGDLARSIEALRSAMEASLDYDELAPDCHPARYCVEDAKRRTDLYKPRFVRLFNPYAEQYLGQTYAAGEI